MLCRERDEGEKAAQMTCDTLVKDTCARQQQAERKRGRDAWPPLALAYWFVFCEEINELRKETGNDMRNLNHSDHRGLVLSIAILNLERFYFCYFYGFFFFFFCAAQTELLYTCLHHDFFFFKLSTHMTVFLLILFIYFFHLFFIFYWLDIWQILS